MVTFPVKATLAIDPVDLAWDLQAEFGPYLKDKPTEGLWLPGRTSPVLTCGKLYFCHSEHGIIQLEEVSADAIKSAKGDIFDDTGAVVIPNRVRQQLRDEPTVPVCGLELVHADVDCVLDELSTTWSRRRACTIDEVLRRFLKPEYANNQDLLRRFLEIMTDTRRQIMDFVGDDRWVIHVKKIQGTDILIQKWVDWRIYDWERRMASGEWV